MGNGLAGGEHGTKKKALVTGAKGKMPVKTAKFLAKTDVLYGSGVMRNSQGRGLNRRSEKRGRLNSRREGKQKKRLLVGWVEMCLQGTPRPRGKQVGAAGEGEKNDPGTPHNAPVGGVKDKGRREAVTRATRNHRLETGGLKDNFCREPRMCRINLEGNRV